MTSPHPSVTYESITYDAFVRRRQQSEEMQLPGLEQGHSDGEFEALEGKHRKLIREARHFYLATVTGTGWPYVQHRGGPAGFVHINRAGTQLAWAEFQGNNQFVSTGNVDRDGRVSLFFVDYVLRSRLKVFGHARVVEVRDDPELLEWVTTIDGKRLRQRITRIFVVDVVAVDANCSKQIQPRWTKDQVDRTVDLYKADIDELRLRVEELEAECERLRREGEGAH